MLLWRKKDVLGWLRMSVTGWGEVGRVCYLHSRVGGSECMWSVERISKARIRESDRVRNSPLKYDQMRGKVNLFTRCVIENHSVCHNASTRPPRVSVSMVSCSQCWSPRCSVWAWQSILCCHNFQLWSLRFRKQTKARSVWCTRDINTEWTVHWWTDTFLGDVPTRNVKVDLEQTAQWLPLLRLIWSITMKKKKKTWKTTTTCTGVTESDWRHDGKAI